MKKMLTATTPNVITVSSHIPGGGMKKKRALMASGARMANWKGSNIAITPPREMAKDSWKAGLSMVVFS